MLALGAVTALLAASADGLAMADGVVGGEGGGTTASTSHEVVLERGDRGPAVGRVQRRLRVDRSLYFGRATESAVRRFQRHRRLSPDGVVGPITRRAMRLGPFSRASVERGSGVRLPRALVRIAKCESGGDPHAIGGHGRYRGKYQFTRATWRALGGHGDPAAAPESRQDRLALKLYRQQGTAPWGSCA
jgi:peptidoglycan hydrolase-like protein with peptidoglycan-binding domain